MIKLLCPSCVLAISARAVRRVRTLTPRAGGARVAGSYDAFGRERDTHWDALTPHVAFLSSHARSPGAGSLSGNVQLISMGFDGHPCGAFASFLGNTIVVNDRGYDAAVLNAHDPITGASSTKGLLDLHIHANTDSIVIHMKRATTDQIPAVQGQASLLDGPDPVKFSPRTPNICRPSDVHFVSFLQQQHSL